jgi:hypothetical protein
METRSLGGRALPVPAGCAGTPSSRLVKLRAVDEPAENATRLNGHVREPERQEHHSVVEVVVRGGGSVSSSLFTARGLCAVARARGWARATTTSLGADRWRVGNADVVVAASADPVEAIEAMSPKRRPTRQLSHTECLLLGG